MQSAPERPASPELVKNGRSFLMWHSLAAEPSLQLKNKQIQFNGKTYHVIDSTLDSADEWLTDASLSLASAGGHVHAREIFLIRRHEGRLAQLLATYVESQLELPRHLREMHEYQIHEVLFSIATFVRDNLNPSEIEVKRIFEQHKSSAANCISFADHIVPCIDFEIFLRSFAACRHFAALTCLLIATAIQQGILPTGTIHLERFDQDTSAHAWAIYTYNDVRWQIDPTMLSQQHPAHSVIMLRRANATQDESPPTVPNSPVCSLSASQCC